MGTMGKPVSTVLREDDLRSLMFGACLFASGGGGPLSIAEKYLARIGKSERGKQGIPLVNVTSLEAGQKSAVFADVGSPDDAIHGDLAMTAPINGYKAMADLLGKPVLYPMAIELGACNTLVPFYIASAVENRVAVVDADPSRRAVPLVCMGLLDTAGVPCCPAAVASDTDSTLGTRSATFSGFDSTHLEGAVRGVVSIFDGVGGMGAYPMDSDELATNAKTWVVPGSLGLAWEVGVQIRKYEGLQSIQAQSIQALLIRRGIQSFQLFEGTLDMGDPVSVGGFDYGVNILRDGDREFRVYYKNENLLAWDPRTGRPKAMGPDGVTFLLAEDGKTYPTGTPVSNAGLVNGKRYAALGMAAYEGMRNHTIVDRFQESTADILKILGDKIDPGPYIPIEELNRS